MHQHDPHSSTDPSTDRRRRARKVGRALGLTLAAVTSLAGLALAWVLPWLSNCKWGFFGETGPAPGSGRYGVDDLAAALVVLAIATSPWLIALAWRPRASRRRILVGIAAAVAVVIALRQLPLAIDPEGYWSRACT